MNIRRDKSFTGGEEINFNPKDNELVMEGIIFILISIGCIIFFLMHPGFLEEYFKFRKLKTFLGVFIFVFLSPCGAHLIARGVTHIFTRLKCAILN